MQAAARHQCTYLIEMYEREFLDCGGDPSWLNGLEYIPKKLLAIYEINKILAHRPWLLTTVHIEALTKGSKCCWTLAEVVHAIVILSHFHSLSSFVFSCGLTQELENASPIIPPPTMPAPPSPPPAPLTPPFDCTNQDRKLKKRAVDELMAKMLDLSQQSTDVSEDELIDRFKSVEMQTAALAPPPPPAQNPVITAPIKIYQYIDDAAFTYVDFAKRGAVDVVATFRVQDYSWDDHGYSLVNRLYNDVGYLLDRKFRATYNLTYFTMVSGRADNRNA